MLIPSINLLIKISMSSLIDDFLEGLDQDRTQVVDRSDRITKVLMSSRDNQGTVILAPFMGTNGKFYSKLRGVREFNSVCSLYQNGEKSSWIKILPKDQYEEMTAEEAALYVEVTGLFDEACKVIEAKNPKDSFNKIRVRNYSLFQGVLLKHNNRQGAELKDNKDKAVLLIFPSIAPLDAMANAITAKINAMNGSKEWVPAIFAPTDKGREGVMSISFSKPNSPGYNAQVAFEFNSTYVKLVDPNAGFPSEVVSLFGDPVADFLGWQRGKEKKFNVALFKEIKAALTMEIKSASAKPATPTEAPKNNNGVDPMTATSSATQEVKTTADPVATPTAATVDPASIKGVDDLPF